MSTPTTRAELLFSERIVSPDGIRGDEISVAETIVVEWETVTRKFKAHHPDLPACIGYGDSHTEAVLQYLLARLGLHREAAPVRYSARVY